MKATDRDEFIQMYIVNAVIHLCLQDGQLWYSVLPQNTLLNANRVMARLRWHVASCGSPVSKF